ncbi:MAG TPA: hypothetical protein VIY68_16125, partial [Steroidobacteraceae bacterium]
VDGRSRTTIGLYGGAVDRGRMEAGRTRGLHDPPILAVCGAVTGPLTLVALLVAGTSILMTGSTLTGAMVGFMRESPGDDLGARRLNAAERTGTIFPGRVAVANAAARSA